MLGSLIRQLIAGRRARGAQVLQQAVALHQAGRYAEVEQLTRAALARNPDDPEALKMLAATLCAQGRSHESLVHLRRVAELTPDAAEAHLSLGTVLAATGNTHEAIESYRRAAHLRPDLSEARYRLATMLKALGRYDDAEDCCRSGLLHDPCSALLHHVFGNVLFEQGRVDAAIVEIRTAVELDPDSSTAHGDLARMLNYTLADDPLTVWQAHRAWAERHASRFEAAALPNTNDPDPMRRLRVGYVSPYFHRHAVTFFFESILQHHDRFGVDVTLYADVAQPDEYSRRLQSYSARWRDTFALSDDQMARMIRDDAMDVLVDLSGQTPRNRLLVFARRPAPVQVTWIGYPNTTGLATMDYRFTDALCDPPGTTEHLHSEALVRLPGIYMSWRPPEEAPDVGRLPALKAGRVTFGSFNSCYKLSPRMLALWSGILEQLPEARLKLLDISGKAAKSRILELFAANGADLKRIEIVPRLSFADFLAVYGEVDIALDTFPYHGTTTTCFSLWMGLPVVTLAGGTHVSRVGVSMLTNVGLAPLVARDGDEYIHIATRLARNLNELADLRASLRDRMRQSPNTDGRCCAINVEHAYREMWAAWCRKHAAT